MKMMKKTARFICMLCSVICVFTLANAGGVTKAVEIEERYTGISKLFVGIDISDYGIASCYGSATGRSGYYVDLTLELQQDGETIKEWHASGTGFVEIDKIYAVASNHDYQTVVTATITTSEGTEIIEPPLESPVYSF